MFYLCAMERGNGILPGQRLRARGAQTNRAGRFERHARDALDDGWDIPFAERLVKTEVRLERPRSALTYNRSPDLPFDRSVNPLPGLRAWLHLLLRAAQPCFFEPVARAGL
jgi:hypothetical protein